MGIGRWSGRCAYLAVVGSLLWVGPVRADERANAEIAVSRFKAGQYEKALVLLEEILAKPTDASDKPRMALINQVRPIYAAVLIWLDRLEEADAVILQHLRQEPFYQPPPGEFHQKIVERFIKVRADNRAELEKIKRLKQIESQKSSADKQKANKELLAEIKRLQKLTAQERVVERRSRWVAMLPFGVGQFQNDDTALGVVFASAQVLTLAGSIASAVVANDLASTRCGVADPSTQQLIACDEVEGKFKTARTVNWVTSGALGAVAIAGIVQAQMAFEEQSVTFRKRPKRGDLRVAPMVATDASAGGLQLSVRF